MSTSPSPNETEDADIVSEGLITHNAIEEGQMVVSDECVSNANRDPITMEIDELYSIYEDLDLDTVRVLEDNGWPVNPSSFQLVPASSTEAVAAAAAANDVDGVANSQVSCFMAWKSAKSNEMAVPVVTGIESQKLLKKVVDCGARMSTGRGSRAALTQESGIKNHVISERRRREKLNEMFLILKSIVPSIHKVN